MNASQDSVLTLRPTARADRWARRIAAARRLRVAARPGMLDRRMATRGQQRASPAPVWLRRASALFPQMVDRFAGRIAERAVPATVRRQPAEPADSDWMPLDMPLVGAAETDTPPTPSLPAAPAYDALPRIADLPPLGARRPVAPTTQANPPPASRFAAPASPPATSPTAPRPTPQRIRRYSRVEEIDPLTLAAQNERQRPVQPARQPSFPNEAAEASTDQPASARRAVESQERSGARPPDVIRRAADAPARSQWDADVGEDAPRAGRVAASRAPQMDAPDTPRSILQRMRQARAEQLRRQMERSAGAADATDERFQRPSSETDVERPRNPPDRAPAGANTPPPMQTAPVRPTSPERTTQSSPSPVVRRSVDQPVTPAESTASDAPPPSSPAVTLPEPQANPKVERETIARSEDRAAGIEDDDKGIADDQAEPIARSRPEALRQPVQPLPAASSDQPATTASVIQRQLAEDKPEGRKFADARHAEGHTESSASALAALAERVIARAAAGARLSINAGPAPSSEPPVMRRQPAPRREETADDLPVANRSALADRQTTSSREEASDDLPDASRPSATDARPTSSREEASDDLPVVSRPSSADAWPTSRRQEASEPVDSPMTQTPILRRSDVPVASSPADAPRAEAVSNVASDAAVPTATARASSAKSSALPLRRSFRLPLPQLQRAGRQSASVLPQARLAESASEADADRLVVEGSSSDARGARPIASAMVGVARRAERPTLTKPATTLARKPARMTRREKIDDAEGTPSTLLRQPAFASDLPLAARVRAPRVQRTPDPAALPQPAPPAPEPAAAPDVQALARQVYPILKRMLAVERERLRGF